MSTQDLKRRLSVMMASKNLVNRCNVDEDLKCKLCLAVLFEPVECQECSQRFCNGCFHRFSEAVRSCPKGCHNPQFTPIIEKLRSRLSRFQFICTNKEYGCKDQVRYDQVIQHENT